MPDPRCGHFSLEVHELHLTNTPAILRVPIRRCALAERMVQLISTTETGREIVRKITIVSHQALSTEAEEVVAEAMRVAFGPDLEAIHPHECTVTRCQDSCTPSYKLLLRHFEMDTEADKENGDGCLEIAHEQDALLESGY